MSMVPMRAEGAVAAASARRALRPEGASRFILVTIRRDSRDARAVDDRAIDAPDHLVSSLEPIGRSAITVAEGGAGDILIW
jgi:hypothetical protein